MLAKLIVQNTGCGLTQPNFGATLIALLRYCVGLDTSAKMQARTKPCLPRQLPNGEAPLSAQQLRLAFEKNYYNIVGVRAFVARLLQTKALPRAERVKLLAKQCGVKLLDAKWICVWLDVEKEEADALRKHIATLGRDIGDVAGIERQFSSVYSAVSKYLRRTTIKKLSFLRGRYNMELHDLELAVLDQVLPKYLMRAPFDNDVHALCYIKQYIAARVHNVREHFTRMKRKRYADFINAQGQWEAHQTIQSHNMLATSEDGEELDVGQYGVCNNAIHETRLSIEQCASRLSEKAQTLISLIMGSEHKEFTRWCRERDYIKETETCTDLPESTLLRVARQWMGLSQRTVEKLFARLRNEIGPVSFAVS